MRGVVGNGAGPDLPRLLPATGPRPGIRRHTRIYCAVNGGIPTRGIPVVGWLDACEQLVEFAAPPGRQFAPIRPGDRYQVASIRVGKSCVEIMLGCCLLQVGITLSPNSAATGRRTAQPRCALVRRSGRPGIGASVIA